MNQDLFSVAQKAMSEFLESTGQFQEMFAEQIANISEPDRKEALQEYLALMRSTQAQLQEAYPGELKTMVQGITDAQSEFAAIEQKKDQLLSELEEVRARAAANLEEAKKTRAERARAPKPPRPADLARERLAAMARRHGVVAENSPALTEGPKLKEKLLGILQPKANPQANRARAIGNIWENWPAAETTEPESEDGQP